MKLNDQELNKLIIEHSKRDNLQMVVLINAILQYRNKTVKVVKGRKVPIGTTGTVFWVNRYKINTWLGTTKVGIKDDKGNVSFTADTNIELVK